MRTINDLTLSYPNFKEFDIIQPYETNQNNEEMVIKINEIIEYFNPILSENGAVNIKMPSISGIEGTNIYDTLLSVSEFLDTNYNRLETHKVGEDHDFRYYTKDELNPYLRGGDTIIHEEVFVIINPDVGDGSFIYSSNGEEVAGELTEDGKQIFTLNKGTYLLGMNRVEAVIDDTLRRSVASGGIEEVSENKIALTHPEDIGTEITFKYYERIGVAIEYNINLSKTKPIRGSGNTMWFKILGQAL